MFLGLLQEEFKVTIVSPEYILGMQIMCQSDRSIFMSQKAYTNKILKKFNTTKAKGVSMTASREDSDNHKNVTGKLIYCEAASSFLYLAAATRPDVAFTVNKVHGHTS